MGKLIPRGQDARRSFRR